MSFDVDARVENAAAIAWLKPRMKPGTAASLHPDDTFRPYETLGTHPDLVAYLWDTLAKELPSDARRVVYGAPALVRGESGVMFGLAIGTHVCALRVPPSVHAAALAAGATTAHEWGNGTVFDAPALLGPEWIITGWARDAAKWCHAAYEHAT